MNNDPYENTSLEELFHILRYKTYTLHGKEECADYLLNLLTNMGLNVKAFNYGRDKGPIIVAKTPAQAKKRILLYSHYDVKPPGDISKWCSDPFVPTVKGNKIFCRGSGDAKGQLFIALKSAEMFLKETRKNGDDIGITLLFEGEEESGSSQLEEFCSENSEYLESSLAIILDSHWYFDNPVIAWGTRGQMSFYLDAYEKRQNGDLHAGNYGGIFDGAIYRMLKALTECFEDIKVVIPNFYSNLEKELQGPYASSFSVCSIEGGDMTRSLIPRHCRAQIDIRMIKDQDPDYILEALRGHFLKHEIELNLRQISKPVIGETDESHLKLLSLALKNATNKEPVMMDYIGATVPMEKLLKLNIPVYILPFAQSDENNHAPNENISIDNIYMGIEFVNNFICLLAKNNYLK